MTKEAYVEVEIDKNDILDYLNFDFYDLPWDEARELMDIMKEHIFNYKPPYYGHPVLISAEILDYLARNPTILREVYNGLIEKEANN